MLLISYFDLLLLAKPSVRNFGNRPIFLERFESRVDFLLKIGISFLHRDGNRAARRFLTSDDLELAVLAACVVACDRAVDDDGFHFAGQETLQHIFLLVESVNAFGADIDRFLRLACAVLCTDDFAGQIFPVLNRRVVFLDENRVARIFDVGIAECEILFALVRHFEIRHDGVDFAVDGGLRQIGECDVLDFEFRAHLIGNGVRQIDFKSDDLAGLVFEFHRRIGDIRPDAQHFLRRFGLRRRLGGIAAAARQSQSQKPRECQCPFHFFHSVSPHKETIKNGVHYYMHRRPFCLYFSGMKFSESSKEIQNESYRRPAYEARMILKEALIKSLSCFAA